MQFYHHKQRLQKKETKKVREMEKRGAEERKNKKPSQSLPFLCFSSSRPRSHRRVPAQMIENDKKGTEKEEIREVNGQ
jgi:hypothetical protein